MLSSAQNVVTHCPGDSTIDIEEGKNTGCGITVGVTTGAQTREQLATASPTLIVDNLAEILEHI